MEFDLETANLVNDILYMPNDDGSITCIPMEVASEEQLEWFAEFEAAFPNGKPQTPVKPSRPVPTQDDYLLDLDYRLSKIELGV